MTQKSAKELAKFLAYALGRGPDEFGLVMDAQGYCKIKDLLKALNEEEGWRHVRRAGIDEILITLSSPPVEILEDRIRAVDREHLPRIKPARDLPKLLYACIRQKAHPHVPDKGIFPLGGMPYVILTPDREMAERMGRRFDSSPVMLTVQVAQAQAMGVDFQSFGEHLFLAAFIPPGCFTAPPLPKVKEESGKKREVPEETVKPKTPGSFVIEYIDPEERRQMQQNRRKKKMEREKDKKMRRKQKQKMWER
ncbi:MAG: RNA 2'-phosphotransferase [Desulfococcaceae bacterium]